MLVFIKLLYSWKEQKEETIHDVTSFIFYYDDSSNNPSG